MISSVHFVETPTFDRAGPTIGAKHGMALFKQKLRKVGIVLPGVAQCDCTVSVFSHSGFSSIASKLKRGETYLCAALRVCDFIDRSERSTE